MRRSEGLMQVEVADISADESGIGVAYLGVHIRTVHIDLSAVGVDTLAHLADSHLEDTMGGGIGNHTAGEHIFVLLGFLFPVGEVGVAVLVAFHHHGCEASLHARSGVGAMRRSRDEEHFARVLPCLVQVFTDGYQSAVLSRSTGSRL